MDKYHFSFSLSSSVKGGIKIIIYDLFCVKKYVGNAWVGEQTVPPQNVSLA